MYIGRSSFTVTLGRERDDGEDREEQRRQGSAVMHAASLVCCNQDASRYQALTARSVLTPSRIDVGR